jgi:hypothetical protein
VPAVIDGNLTSTYGAAAHFSEALAIQSNSPNYGSISTDIPLPANMTPYLLSNATLGFSASASVAVLGIVQIPFNATYDLAWGAPMANLTFGDPAAGPVNSTHSLIAVPFSFFNANGILTVEGSFTATLLLPNGTVAGASGQVGFLAPPHTTLSRMWHSRSRTPPPRRPTRWSPSSRRHTAASRWRWRSMGRHTILGLEISTGRLALRFVAGALLASVLFASLSLLPMAVQGILSEFLPEELGAFYDVIAPLIHPALPFTGAVIAILLLPARRAEGIRCIRASDRRLRAGVHSPHPSRIQLWYPLASVAAGDDRSGAAGGSQHTPAVDIGLVAYADLTGLMLIFMLPFILTVIKGVILTVSRRS